MKGIILHGGAGTRLRPFTHTGPKQLIPVANKSISQYVLEDILASGINEIAIVLGKNYPNIVKERFKDGSQFKAKITYMSQGEPLGIAHAVGLCKDFIGEDAFIVYLGDNLLKGGIKKYVRLFNDSNLDAMVLLCDVREPERFGVAEFDKGNNLVRLVEKPEVPPSNYALTGIYFFTPTAFEMIEELKPSRRGELEITDAIQLLINKGHRVGHKFVEGWWKDTGTPEDILEANRLILDELTPLMEGTVEDVASIQGRVSIGKNTQIREGSLVRGPTIIGENSRIEKGVYIGPYTSIGNNVTIMRGEIEDSIIMDFCEFDADERLVGSLIASYSTITSNEEGKPRGRRFILGERSRLEF